MNKKKIIIISIIASVMIVVIFLIIFSSKNKEITKTGSKNNNLATEVFTPDFLTVEEKTKLDIPTDKKIQAITRDESGAITVYKIINNETDITNPSQIK